MCPKFCLQFLAGKISGRGERNIVWAQDSHTFLVLTSGTLSLILILFGEGKEMTFKFPNQIGINSQSDEE